MAIDGYIIRMNLSDVKEAVRLLRINSNNLKSVCKKANETGSIIYIDDVKELQKQQKELWQNLEEILRHLVEIQ